jgi:hypothetical protein
VSNRYFLSLFLIVSITLFISKTTLTTKYKNADTKSKLGPQTPDLKDGVLLNKIITTSPNP